MIRVTILFALLRVFGEATETALIMVFGWEILNRACEIKDIVAAAKESKV